MLKGETIVCISKTTWYGNYTKSVVQILERLALNNDIIFIEYHFTIKDVIYTFLKKQNAPIEKILGFKNRIQEIKLENGSTVKVINMPPSIPMYFLKNERIFELVLKYNICIYKRTLKRVLKKLKVLNPIIITAYNPLYGLKLLKRLNEKLHLYYCYDSADIKHMGLRAEKIEEDYSRIVDGIITTSDFINSQKLQLNHNSFIIKNGVDFKLFSNFSKKEVIKNKRKLIGYIGSLDDRFDIDMVENAVSRLNEYIFLFMGDLRSKKIKERLTKYSNVIFEGPKSPDKIPEILASCDAGIIPYICNEYNKSIYPLKINEYLAVGIPVIMTEFADLDEFKGIVSIAKNNVEFSTMIIKEINQDNEEKIEKRIAFASQNSWDVRAVNFAQIIENHLK